MCGRFLLLSDEENVELEDIMNAIKDKYANRMNFTPGEVFPGTSIPVLTNPSINSGAPKPMHTGASSKRTADIFEPCLMHWGFPLPGKTRSSSIINARSETLTQKPTFKKLVNNQRCIIPANGFYEWAHASVDASNVASLVSDAAQPAIDAKKKTKFLIRPSDARSLNGSHFFYMAGLTSMLRLANGEYADCVVIITTFCSAQMASIHNRMPVIFNRAMADYWMSDAAIDRVYSSGIMNPWSGSLDIITA